MKRMGRDGVSDGERLERARRGRKTLIFGAIAGAGLVTGFAVGAYEGRRGYEMFSGAQGWPPAMALAIVVSYLAAIVIGGVLLARQTDEFERMSQYKAVAVAAFSYIVAYPAWFVLWMGGFVREPMHGVLFLIFWASLALASLFYRFR